LHLPPNPHPCFLKVKEMYTSADRVSHPFTQRSSHQLYITQTNSLPTYASIDLVHSPEHASSFRQTAGGTPSAPLPTRFGSLPTHQLIASILTRSRLTISTHSSRNCFGSATSAVGSVRSAVGCELSPPARVLRAAHTLRLNCRKRRTTSISGSSS